MGRDKLLAKAVGRLARAIEMVHLLQSCPAVDEALRQTQNAKAEVEQQIRENLEWQQQSSR